MPEYRALTMLIPRVAAGTLLLLIAGTYATDNNATGRVNKPIYLGILALAVILSLAFLRSHRPTRIDTALALLASGALIWGIGTIERPHFLASYWEGFGYRVAIAVVVLLLLFGSVVWRHGLPRWARLGLGLVVALCCVSDVLSVIRTIDYMPYVNNNLNEINDMLGPVAGRVPDAAFIPQYTTLYGWLFVPFKHLLSPLALVGAMAIFLTALNVATVLIAIWIVRRVLSINGFLVAVALVVPITYVTSHVAGDQSSIASLFQELPIRVFSGLVVVAVGLKDLVLLYRGTVRARQLVLIGVVCGLVAWNSQDFGLAATAVYGVMILVGSTSSARTRALLAWLAGLILGLLSYPLFSVAIGSPLNLGFVAAFVKLFGSGLGGAPIQVPGPALVVLPIIICSTAAGWTLMRIRRRDGVAGDVILDRATITLTLVGTWSAVSLVYYINRAFAAGQLQTMLLPCAICVAALLSIAMHTDGLRALWQPTSPSTTWVRLSGKARMMPLGIFVCLCFASALLTPDPILAAKSLLHPPAMSGYVTYDLPQLIPAVKRAQTYTSGRLGELTYLGESFNYVSLATRVPSAAVLFPFPFLAVSTVTQVECRYLESHHSQWVVLSLDGVEAFGSSLCGMYHSVEVPGLAHGQLQELR